MRPIPQLQCLALIHEFEGSGGKFEPTRAQDPGGVWEIGWSHKLSGPDDPLWGATLDAAAADALSITDLTIAAKGVCAALGTAIDDLTDGQYAALIDFTYNEGVGRFSTSTLCHYVIVGAFNLVPDEFNKWVYGKVDGQEVKLTGLIRRRATEVTVWNSPTPSSSFSSTAGGE